MKSISFCKWISIRDPVFTYTADFIAGILDKVINLDNISVETIVAKARWRDKLKRFAQYSL